MTTYLRQRVQANELGTVPQAVSSGEWALSFPALSEFLVAVSWSDGRVRLPGTLTLFVEDGVWKICLNDKDQSLITFCSGQSPLEAFQAAERGLVADNLDWRSSRPRNRNKRG